MATTTYLRLFPAVKQFELKNGALNVGGRLFVYYDSTDDLAEIYDENGTRLQQPAILDNDGRALGLFVDSKKVYRLEVQDAFGAMQFTVRKMVPSGGGAGSALGNQYDVTSSDGSITVDKYDDGGVTKFDLGLAPNDSDEFLEWIQCSEEDCGNTWIPAYQSGTMETDVQGVKVHGGHLYHFTNSFTVDPNGGGINYDTFRVTMYCGDNIVDVRDFDIDSSLNDPVLCEFSRDVVPTEDTHVYFKLSIPATCEVSGEVQCHRIYSGVNAVPDTCATKQWVQETFDYNLSSKVDYSAIEYNQYNEITGISGSAIAGGINSAMVSSIASSVASAYTESAFSSISAWTADFSSISSKADQSALTAYQPVSAMSGYATEAYVDAAMGDKLDATASSLFLTSLPDDLATTGDVASAVSGKLDKSASGEFYPRTGNPDGFLTAHQSLAGYATEQYVDSAVSSKLDTSAFASASAGFAPTGDYAYNSSLSAYIPTSASGAFQPSGNYAYASSLSSKMDVSASSLFVQNSAYTAYTANMGDVVNNISSSITSMSADVTGKQDTSAMTAWIPYSALDYSGTAISGIGGSSLAGMGGGADYSGIYPVNVDNEEREISVDSLPLVTDSSMTAYGSAGSSVIGVNLDIMSGKLDSSAQVVTATATQLYAGTAYLTGVNGAPVSASRAGQAVNASLANSAYYDGTGRLISSLPDSATVSAIASAYTTGKQDTLAFAYNTADQISSINGSALGGMDEAAVSGIASAYAESAASGCIPTSMSSDFQKVTGMSSYALSSDVSATVDLVGTQSANWGGSALALSAGPGISLTMVGNTLVASTSADETVLWENTAGQLLSQGITLSESRLNFEMLRFYMGAQIGKSVISYDMPMYGVNRTTSFAIQPAMPFMDTAGTGYAINWQIAITATENAMASVQALYWGKNNFGSDNTASGSWVQGNNNAGVPAVYKVVGINRTAGV